MVTDRLKLVMDLGRFTTTDRSFDEDTRFLTLGAIYGVRDDFDIDIGLKRPVRPGNRHDPAAWDCAPVLIPVRRAQRNMGMATHAFMR